METKDLGTYHLRVEFNDGKGYFQEYKTGNRYSHGRGGESPLTAMRIKPTWESEQQMIDTIQYQYTEGNYSCDCNLRLFLSNAEQETETDFDCGDTLKTKIKSLILIRPDSTKIEIKLQD